MKIMYHIANDWTNSQLEILSKEGHNPKKGYTAYQVDESEYYRLEQLFQGWGIKGARYPQFTKKELSESLLSAKSNAHTHGYPMPDMDFGYLNLTYDLSDYCDTCGIGKQQQSPFRLKSVPKEGKKRLFSIGWVFDEYFVDKDLYLEVFKPLGIKSREVLKYKTDTLFENTLQLVLDETGESLELKGNPIESCPKCGRWKYQPMPQDFYPRYDNIMAPMFKSKEWFGTGAEARKRVFVTKELRGKLIDLKVEKPMWYIPTKSDF